MVKRLAVEKGQGRGEGETWTARLVKHESWCKLNGSAGTAGRSVLDTHRQDHCESAVEGWVMLEN